MQTNSFLRALAALSGAVCLAGCSSADNPYASIKDPPLVQATLHTITFQSADPAAIDRQLQRGFSRMPPAPNYPGSVRVEAALWRVPEDVAASPVVLLAPAGSGPNYRYLAMPPAGPLPAPDSADSGLVEDFYRNVLDSPSPAADSGVSAARMHSVTFMIGDVLAARRRLQEAGIPITFDAVAITTAYLGDHKLLGITAPDGVIVELVEAAAQ